MIKEEHVQTARDFLVKSDRYFAEGDALQGSEKMWGAAAHSIMAVAQQRGWKYGNHYAIREVARRLADEYDDGQFISGFSVAEKFHANFYHEFMEDVQSDTDRPIVRHFVERVLALIDDDAPEQSPNGIVE